jgi:hypothetical protein
MKNTIGLISLLLLSQSVFAEEMKATETEAAMPSTEMAVPVEEMQKDMPNAMHKETQAQMPDQMAEQSGFSRGSVVRSAFTTEIAEREPTQDLKTLSTDNASVMFFTELRDMHGQTAIHRWEHDGKVVAEVEFNVKGPRWRVWSSKNLTPQNTGDWKVSVVNAAGEVISEKKLNYEVATMPVTESNMDNNTPAVAPEPAQ